MTLSIAGALLLLTSLAYVVVRGISRPIERMGEAAERTAAGDITLQVPYEGNDEVARLAQSINRLERSFLDKIAELDADRRLMESLLAGMKEGLLLVGADRRIQLANDAFRSIFDVRFDPTGHVVAEAVRNPAVLRDLDQALLDGREVREMVVRAPDSGRSFEVHVTPIAGREPHRTAGALVLFFDISRLTALEGMRREFVADVSHELRTPLTSIKAFLETLLDGGFEDRERAGEFLRIALKHANRMGALIDDLTDLSLIETGAVLLDLEEVNLAELAKEVCTTVAHRHAAVQVDLRVAVPDSFVVRADRRRLEQILVNLLENAVKFNRPGGSVTISARREDRSSFIEVEDTGIGIPFDCLEKVFNRFYRVDRGRSQEMGGTGLGLAIVKHLMRLHGGSVRVESELNRGSKFTLEFRESAGPSPMRPLSTSS